MQRGHLRRSWLKVGEKDESKRASASEDANAARRGRVRRFGNLRRRKELSPDVQC